MRLAVVTSFPPKASPEVDHAYHLCANLAAHGTEVHVLAQKGCVRPDVPGLTVHPLMRDWSWAELPRLKRALRACAPDGILLVYLYANYNQHPMITLLPAVARRLLPGRPFVTLFEDADGLPYWTWQTPDSRMLRGLLKRAYAGRGPVDDEYGVLLRDSDHFLMVSDRVGAKLAARDPSMVERTTVLAMPPIIFMAPEDEETRRRAREQLGAGPEDCLLAYFGYIYQGKGLDTLLRALQVLIEARDNVRLVVIGGSLEYYEFERAGDEVLIHGAPNYLEDIKKLAEELGVADRVVWTGAFAFDSDLPSTCLRAADICLLPYDRGVCVHNSSCTVVAAHGLPIITTRGDTLDPEFVHDANVLLCPPQDPAALAEAVERLLADGDLVAQLCGGALRLAEECFSWDRAVQDTLAAFQSGPAATEGAGP